MVIANVLNTYTTASGLWQYDYGQILRIQNLKLPHAVEIHFSLQEKGGESVTRVGTTRDNVTDVVIPDSMLENGDTTADYKIYAFIYLTDSESGQTEYKISMSVKARPKPEQFEKPEDEKLFRQAIAAVNESATSAQESATRAETAKEESVAAAKKAKQSAEEASTSAQNAKNSADASKESEKTANSAANASISAKNTAVSAAKSAEENALAASRSAQEAQTSAEQADTAAKNANESKQAIEQLKTNIESTAEQIATDRTAVEADKKEVKKAKSDVENLKEAIEQKSSEAITEINTARNNAVNDVNTAKDTAVNTITQEKESAVNAVNDAKDNVVAEINKNENVQQIKENKDDIAEAQTDIEELKDKKITKFYANNLGETHLKDSDSGKIQDMFLYGKSEQKQYTGKNLLELSDNRVQNGNLKFQISQGIITFSGSTDNASFIEKIKDFIVPSDGTYTISTNSDSDNESPRILLSINGGSFESALNGATKELTTADVVSLYIRISTIDSYNGRTIKPMIEKGSEVTSYEPYTGGQPSPSPDYPQEIKSVVNPVVKIHGKNLLDAKMINRTINGIEFVPRADGTLAINGTATANVTYTIVNNFALKAGTYSIKGCKAYYIAKNGKTGWFGTDKNTFTVATFDSDVKLNILVYIPTGTTMSAILKPMLAKGNIEREYEQYKEQIVNLPYTLNAIPVKNGGNITIDGQQYIADYVDVERGVKVQMIKKWTCSTLYNNNNNVTHWYLSSTITDSALNNSGVKAKDGILCNGLPVVSQSQETDFDYPIVAPYGHSDKVEFRFMVLKSLYNTWEDFADAIKGCEFYYPLAAPIETKLTQEEIKAFKELATYYLVTNVSVTSDELDGYTTFNYPVSMKNGWDYVKQQLGDTRDYIYDVDKKAQDIDTQSAEAYVNSEYAVALTELEVM